MFKFYQVNKIPIYIACIHWFVTTAFQVDRLFFTYHSETKYFIVVKFLYLCFLICSWCFGFDVQRKMKEGNEQYRRAFDIFLVYSSLMMGMLAILWPGTWGADDIWVAACISSYKGWYPWQNILTGLYQDILLQILPFPGGIILLQNILISICVAFSVTKLEYIFNIKKIKYKLLDILTKILPFLAPPILLYQFSGMRMGFYVYLELVMIIMLICMFNENKKYSFPYIMTFCVLCVIVSSWRTESFVYVISSCIMIIATRGDRVSSLKKIFCVFSIVVGFLCVSKFQNKKLNDQYGDDYKVMSLIRPCVEVVRASNLKEDSELLSDIGKVLDLNVVLHSSYADGETMYWCANVTKRGYSKKDYSSFFKAFIKLCLKYPRVVARERWTVFIDCAGVNNKTRDNVVESSTLFDDVEHDWQAREFLDRKWIANVPTFKKIRKKFIQMLGMRRPNSKNTLFKVVHNVITPLICLIFGCIEQLVKKRWYLFGIFISVLVRLPIIILTEPAPLIMYLFSFYLLGYTYLLYRILVFKFSFNRCKYNYIKTSLT